MKITKVHLIRHGQSQANIDQILCGQFDSPLSQQGVIDVQKAAESYEIRNLLHLPCFTSPLIRARETARILGFKNQTFHDELMETNTGDFSHRKFADVTKTHPEFDHYITNLNARYPNGESTQEMLDRAWSFFRKLTKDSLADEIVIVAHGGSLNSIVGHSLGASFNNFPCFSFENNKITSISKSSGASEYWSLLRMNVI